MDDNKKSCLDDIRDFFKNLGDKIKHFFSWLSRNISKLIEKIKKYDFWGFFKDCIKYWNFSERKKTEENYISVFDIDIDIENGRNINDIEIIKPAKDNEELLLPTSNLFVDNDDYYKNNSIEKSEDNIFLEKYINISDTNIDIDMESFFDRYFIDKKNTPNKSTDVDDIFIQDLDEFFYDTELPSKKDDSNIFFPARKKQQNNNIPPNNIMTDNRNSYNERPTQTSSFINKKKTYN